MNSIEVALAACRFFYDASLMCLWGASAYLLFFVSDNLRTVIWQRLSRICGAAITMAGAVTLLQLPVQAAAIGDAGWSDAFDWPTLSAIMFETSIGTAWIAQLAAVILLVIANRLRKRFGSLPIVLSSGFGLTSLSLNGHAVMNDAPIRWGQQLNDSLHVLMAGGWVGGLVALSLILRQLDSNAHGNDVQFALRRFSTAGHIVVSLTVVSGVLNSLFILGHLPQDLNSGYQSLLLAKIAVVCGMILLAVINRYVFVPWLSQDRSRATAAIWIGTSAEICLALAALLLVSVFGRLEPM